MISEEKIIAVLADYEKGANEQMKNLELKETKSIMSEESVKNFELIGAMAQFMTVRDIAKDLGVLEELQTITLK